MFQDLHVRCTECPIRDRKKFNSLSNALGIHCCICLKENYYKTILFTTYIENIFLYSHRYFQEYM